MLTNEVGFFVMALGV